MCELSLFAYLIKLEDYPLNYRLACCLSSFTR